jgi:crotonobetainyl-CoA:carnitine CoA-transferase CaiB-like acyl-CoA transferase
VIDEDSAGPLAGLVVADFSRVLAGPYATMVLGDMGATVIKVEGPGTGDDTRTWRPPVVERAEGPEASYYLSINRNKHSVVLDLKDPDDLATAQALAARADVMIENFMTGTLARFGLDEPTVRATNAGVVYCSITGFGDRGGAKLGGYDLLIQATSGLMSLTGAADGEPARAGVAMFDVMCGLHAATAILGALRHRDATGEGQHLRTNLLSTALSCLVDKTSAYVAAGVVPTRMGNAHQSLFPYEPLPTADGDLIVIAANDHQFRRLCGALGVPELLGDPRFGSMVDRTRHRDELRPLLLERLATRGAQEWFDVLSAAGVPCGPINTVDQGVELAESLGLDPVVHPGGGVATIRNPVEWSATPPEYRRTPPPLGADTDAVRTWLRAER